MTRMFIIIYVTFKKVFLQSMNSSTDVVIEIPRQFSVSTTSNETMVYDDDDDDRESLKNEVCSLDARSQWATRSSVLSLVLVSYWNVTDRHKSNHTIPSERRWSS